MSSNRPASRQTGKRAARGLGRGLSSLLGDNAIAQATAAPATASGSIAGVQQIPVEWINVGPWQPRRRFEREPLQELAASIKEKGIVQPILLRPDPKNASRYQLVAGERRWRAAQLAKLHQVPAIIRDLAETDCYEIALIENIQRSDLTVIEEAQGYQKLLDTNRYTQDQLAGLIGKSRSHVANLLRLLGLPEAVQSMLLDRQLTMGQARPLIGHPKAEALARTIIAKQLSARQAEALAKGAPASTGKAGAAAQKPADIRALEQTASQKLGLTLRIDWNESKECGKVTIDCRSLDQMTDFLAKLGID
jgi:ParB family chromosome partitioning protein